MIQKKINSTIQSYGLQQFIKQPTHKLGHSLDVVIASHNIVNDNSINFLTNQSAEFPKCDHFAILFSLKCSYQPVDDTKTITFRNYKNIDLEKFKLELFSLLSMNSHDSLSFEQSVSHFNTCTSTLNKYAPLVTKTIRDIHTAPWFDTDYKIATTCRRKAEKVWKKSGLQSDYDTFNDLRQKCNKLADKKKRSFYQSKFLNHNNSQKGLYQFVNTFLDQTPELTLPPSESIQSVVNDFNRYFTDKIDKIHATFQNHATEPYLSKVGSQGSHDYREIINIYREIS